ncbi:outer membrane protein assembly factor BamB family protein [Halopiger djelfimassiliensis]|uniref:outer membrane protein assembly factor BamB family protein n=1 Tax=Halopiger djelfimassiliensis TaxID=1293047 RepID=UPI0018A80366|nr:PQQ-binding-like beta-propeller repeat protein [Halopiger djelfimassiliensis]
MTAGMATLAGCNALSDDGDKATADASPGGVEDDGEYGPWPMVRYNAANRLSVPHSGLDGEPEIRWTTELEGIVEPPVVYNDTAFVSHNHSSYTAVDLSNGDPIWNHETSDRKAIAVSEAALFVAGEGVEALDHDKGDVLWRTNHDQSVESLRVHDELIYAGLEDRVLVLDKDGEEQLVFEVDKTVQSLAIDENKIIVRSRPDKDKDGFIMAGYDRNTGDFSWREQITHVQSWGDDRQTRTFPLINGEVFTVDEKNIISIDTETGERSDVIDLDHTPWSRPTIYDNNIYVSTGVLRSYNLETAEKAAEWDPEEKSNEAMLFADGNSYAVHSTGWNTPQELISIDPETGDVNWGKETVELSENHMPVILNGLILLPIDDPGLVAFG